MKFLIVLCALVAAVAGDVSHLPANKYLPPSHHHAASAPAVSYSAAPSSHVEVASAPVVSYSAPQQQSYQVAASAPTVSYSAPAPAPAPAAQSYHVEAASTPAVSYSAPATESYHVEAASAPAASYSAPATDYESTSIDAAASEPAHTYSDSEGYRYKTVKRRVIRRRREVGQLSSEYLPPVAASAPVAQYEPAQTYSVAASEPAFQYSAPAASYETGSYEGAASEPAHSYSSAEGYRYKTAKRRVVRRQRRDVSHLSSEYLPPHQGAASAPTVEYLPPAAASAPVAQYESAPTYAVAASAPAVEYSAPAASYETASYETAASEPAHTFSSAEGYRYKTAKRRVIRRQRRDVSHLSSEYLPPTAQYESAPSYSAAASEPAFEYSAPAESYETTSYEGAASEPAHSYSSAEGYRYKTAKRRVVRRQRRDVSHLSSEYLPPHQGAASAPTSEYLPPAAASAPVAQYESAPTYAVAASAPAVEYSAPAASYETASYETTASEPAHTFSSAEGYRYKTAKRRVIRRQRRDVSHLSSEYLPPTAQYESAPSYSAAASEPAFQYSAPAESYETTSYEGAASEPAHSYSSAEGYRYRTAKRRVVRRQRRDVSHLSSEYLPPVAASAPVAQYESAASEPAFEYSAPAASYETASYETAASEPAHSYSSDDGYRYKTIKRRVIRRQRRDVSHLSSEYLPPAAASTPAVEYESAPVYTQAASAPDFSYSAPAVSETTSYEVAATEPAHSYSSAEGYRYKTAKRRVIRRRRY